MRDTTDQPVDLSSPVTLLHGAVEDTLRLIPTNSCDAVITDPPYALSMGGQTEGWDNYTPRKFSEFCKEWATECRRIVKPGGWLVSFGSGRTWHRMTVGVEDGGFDIIDSINWMYPSGFMRSMDIADRLRKAGHAEVAEQMVGRGTNLHSRHEPAVLARAKVKGSVVGTVAEFGTATVDIESTLSPDGSAPTNVLVQHDGECTDTECLPGCPYPELGPHADRFPSFRFASKPNDAERPFVQVEAGEGTERLTTLGQVKAWTCAVCGAITQSYMGSGSKFSNRPHRVCDCAEYVPLKGNFSSKIKHNTVKPLSLMRHLVRLLSKPGDLILEPFAGSGATIEAALLEDRRCVAVERDEKSIELCRVRLRRQGCFIPD